MPDYYPLIAQAVSKLPENTPQARQELFEQARTILVDQLRKRQPPTSEAEIIRERAALDEAIRKVHCETAKDTRLHAGSIDGPPPKSAEEGKSESRVFEQGAAGNGQPRGRITISEGERPVIELGKTADSSTFINLTAHAWLEMLMSDATHPQAPVSLRQDARAVLKWLGVARLEAIETRHHNQFARAFERYLMEGRAPSGALAPAFAVLSGSLTKIYGTHSLNVSLDEQIRRVFDRLLATPDQIATCTADRERAVIIAEQSSPPRPLHSVDKKTEDKESRERETIERNSALAQYVLGLKYREGRGIEKSCREAVACFRRAAEQGFAPAENALGAMYADGNGIEKNEHEAVVWFRRAAERGHAGGQYNLGVRYRNGQGIEKDEREAVAWFRRAAERGSADAQNNLGAMYEKGDGVEKDQIEAAAWFHKAAKQGSSAAQCNLGAMYADGRGVEKNEHAAVIWFRKAAEQRSANAYYNLGVMYAHGQGVEQDEREAVAWYRKAVEQNYAPAQFNLGKMYADGRGVEKDERAAVACYRSAAEQGSAVAQYSLGVMCFYGRGVEKDEREAMRLFKLAAAKGEPLARAALEQTGQKDQRQPPVAPPKPGFFRRWRIARAEAAAKRADLERRFQAFLLETEPFVPESPHPKAALYRQAWKRAAVLGIIYQRSSDPERVAHYQELEKLAGERYFQVAPATLYGKAPLQMGEKTGERLLEIEMQRLFPTREKQRARPLACIYIGTCDLGRVYVGQTIGAPESRWVQHRFAGTGPFKQGEQYVRWEVIEGGIDPSKLDERESYYIGFFDANKKGYNETQGNDWRAYHRGQADKVKQIRT